MGSRSGSEERSKKHRKRKKKKISSSRSRSRSPSYDSRSNAKHKKSSKGHKRRSRSRDRPRRRSRSRSSSGRRRGGSRDRGRSPVHRRRSSSRDRRRRSRSSSSARRSPEKDRRRRRSRSAQRRRSSSRSRSRSKSASRQSPSPKRESEQLSATSDLTPAEQVKIRMQSAIEKAIASDETLHHGRSADAQAAVTASLLSLTPEEAEKRRKQIEEIESERFKRRAFKTGATATGKPKAVQDPETLAHESAIFGSTNGAEASETTSTVAAAAALAAFSAAGMQNDNGLIHPLLFGEPGTRMARWITKLDRLRREHSTAGSGGIATSLAS